MHETAHALLHLDFPAPGVPIAPGAQVFRGWVVAKAGGHFTDVRLRLGTIVFPGIHGLPRRDLASHFGAASPYLLAEFEIPVTLPPGKPTLTLEGCDISGAWVAIDSLTVETTGEALPAAPTPPAALKANEIGRAFRILLRKYRSGGNPAALAREIVDATPHLRHLRFAHQPFHGHVNQPAAWESTLFGRLPVAGWLFHETQPIRRVLATTDLQGVQALDTGLPTPEIGARFPHCPHASAAGFEGFIDLPAQLPMPACVRIYAELADGSWHLGPVLRAPAVDHEFEKQPYAKLSLWGFWRAWRALIHAFADANFTLPATAELRAEFSAVLAEWRASRPPATIVPARPPAAHATGRVHLITHNLNREGAPLFLLEYAQCLAKEGLALMVTSAKDGPLRADFERLGAAVGIVDVVPLLRAGDRAATERALAALAAQTKVNDAGLVVANTLSCFWGVHLAHRAGRRSLFYIHESTTPVRFYQGVLAPAVLAQAEEAFRLATRVSFLTAATRHYYEPLSSGANYCLNPGWIDLAAIDAFRAQHSREMLRQRLGVAENSRLIVNVGTVCDRKGQAIFARTVDLLWRRDPALAASAQFLMIGGRDTSYDGILEGILAELHRPNLRVVAETGDVYSWYGAADGFVCSSYEESFPRVVLEAMAFARPILATSVHGIPEIARAGLEAVLVPPGNSQALADGLMRLLVATDENRGLAARARTRLETEFAASQVQPRHVALARTLLSSSL